MSDWARELEVARAAALEAGAVLRDARFDPGTPVVAVVLEPASGRLVEAIAARGAWLEGDGPRRKLAVSRRRVPERMRLGVSRFGRNEALNRLLDETPLGKHAVPRGASTRMLDVAAGLLDATLCLHGRESEWDTCAPGLIIAEAGGRVTDVDQRPLRCNQPVVSHPRGVVTSNGRLHEALCRLAAQFWALHG